MFRPFSPTPPPWHLRRVRTLSLEHLESRVVLSGVPEVATTWPSIYAAIPTDYSVQVATTSIVVDSSADSFATLPNAGAQVPESLPSSTPAPLTTSTTPVGDISDQTIGAPESTLAQTMSPPGSGGAPGLPPWINDFAAILEDGYWRLQGSVLDDSSPAGLTVYFGGILNAQTTTDENGAFELIVADSDLGVGWIYAHTVDVDGLASDYEQVTIYA